MGKEIYFIADTHFGHKNIISYENRPFETVEEMDEAMIIQWNQVVQPEDTVFVLGDFSFYGREKTKEICNRLKGKKMLIMGNHDTKSPNYYLDCGFHSVSQYPIIYNTFWILSHEPLYINQNMPYANIYGHIHGNPIYADYSKQSFCVCVERLAYQPIHFSNIKKKMGIEEQ